MKSALSATSPRLSKSTYQFLHVLPSLIKVLLRSPQVVLVPGFLEDEAKQIGNRRALQLVSTAITEIPGGTAHTRCAARLSFLTTPTKFASLVLIAGLIPAGSRSPSMMLSQSSIGDTLADLAAASRSDTLCDDQPSHVNEKRTKFTLSPIARLGTLTTRTNAG
jgi:hypothetical protein